jgi:hypothetical protein
MMNCFQCCFNFAFNFNLRRYNLVQTIVPGTRVKVMGVYSLVGPAAPLSPGSTSDSVPGLVSRICHLTRTPFDQSELSILGTDSLKV